MAKSHRMKTAHGSNPAFAGPKPQGSRAPPAKPRGQTTSAPTARIASISASSKPQRPIGSKGDGR